MICWVLKKILIDSLWNFVFYSFMLFFCFGGEVARMEGRHKGTEVSGIGGHGETLDF